MIEVNKNVLNEYKEIIERAIILIEDNRPLKDIGGFWDDELILYELGTILKDIKDVLE